MLPLAPFSDPFFLMALFAGSLSATASALIGPFIVIKRISFLAGSISHCILGGMGFCLWLKHTYQLNWLDPFYGAVGSALLAALLLGYIRLYFKEKEDALIATIWSSGMALGIVFLSLTPGTKTDFLHLLFGNLLWISFQDLLKLLLLNFLLLFSIKLFYHRLVLLCLDEKLAYLRGVPVKRLYLFLLCLIALSVVILVQVVGTVLVIALLTLPAMIASLFTHQMRSLLIFSSLIALSCNGLGLLTAYHFDIPPSGAITLIATITYLSTLFFRRKKVLTLK